MAISEELEKQGSWLFRWRSYLPLLFLFLFVVALCDYQWPFQEYYHYKIWAQLCFCVSMSGLAIRCIAVGYAPAGTSGRNVLYQWATQLNTTGLYSLVRHPLYLGNFIIGFGIACAPFVWWLPVIYCLMFCIYYERIMFVEEAYLHRTFGAEFDDWADRTPAFFPRTLRWRKPPLAFSFLNVLSRECSGFMIVILGNAGVQFTEHLIIDRRIVYEVFWVTALVGGSASYFLVQSLKRYTSVLYVPGR